MAAMLRYQPNMRQVTPHIVIEPNGGEFCAIHAYWDNEICGRVHISRGYISAVLVWGHMRECGLGRRLIRAAKFMGGHYLDASPYYDRYDNGGLISDANYERNIKWLVKFYESEGFVRAKIQHHPRWVRMYLNGVEPCM